MHEGFDKIIQIASEEFKKLLPEDRATGVEIEEIEERSDSGHVGNCIVTFSYWARDNKPNFFAPHTVARLTKDGISEDLINPWRRKYKRVEVDPAKNKVIAIRMYEPPLGVS